MDDLPGRDMSFIVRCPICRYELLPPFGGSVGEDEVSCPVCGPVDSTDLDDWKELFRFLNDFDESHGQGPSDEFEVN